MLKAILTYSKKIPVPDSEYSSQGYSLSLETELADTDPASIRQRLHATFELVKSQVEDELSGGKTAIPAAKPNTGNGLAVVKGDSARASNKQVKFLTDLWTQAGGTVADLNTRIRGQFQVGGLYELSRKQASSLLDELQSEVRKAA